MASKESSVAPLILAVIGVLIFTGRCGVDIPNLDDLVKDGIDTATGNHQKQDPAPVKIPASAKEAETLLNGLTVKPRPDSNADYDRDAFGEAWKDIDGNGCNQRDDVLLRDVKKGTVKVAQQGACDHDVLAGTWFDPYTGKTLTFTDLKDSAQSQAIQIDHVVPLSEAFKSGADQWSAERREQYANVLSVLLAVDGPANMSKGDGDPAAWRPRKGFQCQYAKRWIAVKDRWDLAVDQPEVRALREMLAYCPK